VAEKGVFVLFRRGAPTDKVQVYLREAGAAGELPIK
jgi:hypothetical protein